MTVAPLQLEIRDGIAFLYLSHGRANALDPILLQALLDALDEVEGSDARAIVLTGRGSIFSAGVDLHQLLDGGEAYLERFLPLLVRALERLFFFPRPVVAASNGHAIAGGCILVCACDHRLMAEGKGRLGAPELRVGVPFPTIALEILRHALSSQRFQEVVMLGETYLPGPALERGLIDEVVVPERILEVATARAVGLATLSPEVFRITKERIRKPVGDAVRRADEDGSEARIRQIWRDPRTLAAVKDYMEKTLA